MAELDPEKLAQNLETVETATEMAKRTVDMAIVLQRISAAINGTEYVAMTPEETLTRVISQTALNLVKLSAPEEMTLDQELTSDEDLAKQRGKALTKELLNAVGMDDATARRRFLQEYTTAGALAAEHSVAVAEVYRDDTLYREIGRRTQTPAAFAREAGNASASITGDLINAARVRQIELFVPQDRLATMTQDEIDRLAMALQFSDDEQERMEAVATSLEETTRQATTYEFLKTYGYEALINLDAELRDGMVPKRPWVQDVFAEFLAD